MQVTIEEAYAEACRALGESIVRERLISRAVPTTETPASETES